jgi:ATP-dependent Clp protease ATP-binding subunit ClpB
MSRSAQVKLTTASERVLNRATQQALQRRHAHVEPAHLLQALLEDAESAAGALLRAAGADPTRLLQRARDSVADIPAQPEPQQVILGPTAYEALVYAGDVARTAGEDHLSTEHFLIGVAGAQPNARGPGLVATDMHAAGADIETLTRVMRERSGKSSLSGGSPADAAVEDAGDLGKYSIDLTARARNGALDPVVGRDAEIRRVVQVLSRRSKNNPVLIGEPGVGKTTVVEGLAQRMVAGDVPEALRGKRLVSLDLSAIIAGAKYRGEFEERFKAVLEALRSSDGSIVAFIDELHTLVGAGASGEGAMDAGNMLKPMLARGELRLLGATTTDEYRQHIEKDPALERRFQQVHVGEPSVEQTVGILRGLKERYEAHHKASISDAALVAAATLSDRFITGRRLPDKAIDLLDEAAARLRIEIDSCPEDIDDLRRQVERLRSQEIALAKEHDAASLTRLEELRRDLADRVEELRVRTTTWEERRSGLDRTGELRERLAALRTDLEIAYRESDWTTASALQYEEIPRVERELSTASEDEVEAAGFDEVGADHVADVVAAWTGISAGRLLEGEGQKLLRMQDVLNARLVGQPDAVRAVSLAVRRARAGVSDLDRPTGSFLFLGPTGVGKTELAKALADLLFDDTRAMIRLDMSEYGEQHAVSRLVGAPPGYVGHDQGGQLTEAVRRRPYAVVLLDEVEKAHPDVFNILLQVLDDGRLTDSQGRTVDFRQVIVILTSNLGAQHLLDPSVSEEVRRSGVMGELRRAFKPEFLNRLDETVFFRPLDRAALRLIVDLQVQALATRVADRQLTLEVSRAAADWLATEGYDPAFGARPVRRLIQREIGDTLASALLEGRVSDGDDVLVDLIDPADRLAAAGMPGSAGESVGSGDPEGHLVVTVRGGSRASDAAAASAGGSASTTAEAAATAPVADAARAAGSAGSGLPFGEVGPASPVGAGVTLPT